jgi:hypothetical protein
MMIRVLSVTQYTINEQQRDTNCCQDGNGPPHTESAGNFGHQPEDTNARK